LIQDNKTSDFSEDSQGTLWLGKRICVPNLKAIKESILREARDSAYSIHPGSTDVQGFKNPILVEWYEARCRGIRSPVRHLSTGKSGTLETSRIATTLKDPRVEMERDRNGLHSWVAPYPSWV
jgi:hypothetical protein